MAVQDLKIQRIDIIESLFDLDAEALEKVTRLVKKLRYNRPVQVAKHVPGLKNWESITDKELFAQADRIEKDFSQGRFVKEEDMDKIIYSVENDSICVFDIFDCRQDNTKFEQLFNR